MDDLGIQILQIPPFDEAIREHWEVNAHDIDLFGFSALCEPAMQYPWSVCINVAEFVTQQPLEGQFRARIGAAIAAVLLGLALVALVAAIFCFIMSKA